MSTSDLYLPISAVERETGLSKDVLRKWESRYGFPAPSRDPQGERAYPPDQVYRLRLIKRLMDSGMRPARIVGKDAASLAALAEGLNPTPAAQGEAGWEQSTLELLRSSGPEGLRRHLQHQLLRQGLAGFVQDTLVLLNRTVGAAWARGELEIHEEHLYTASIQWLLHSVIDGVTDPAGRPRALLTTLPEEAHGLGLLMVGALLAMERAYCISLGPQTPVEEIASAARAHQADLVVLSFSICYPSRRVLPALAELRQRLDASTDIWAGGAATTRLQQPTDGIHIVPVIEDAMRLMGDWRAGRE